MPKNQKKNLYTPVDKEVTRLISSVRGTRLEAPVLISAFASLRRSEMCALQLDDIGDGYIIVNKAVVLNKDKEWVLKATKTEDGTRVTYLPKEVTDRLKKITTGNKIINMNPNQLSSAFTHAVKAAGLKHFRLHALRSYYASVLHSLGVPDKYIMLWGGWKDQATLQKHYEKALDDRIPDMAKIGIDHFSKMIK